MAGTYNDAPGDQLDYRGLKEIFDNSSILQGWLDIEKSVAQAQSDLKIIPHSSAKVIIDNCNIDMIDITRLEAGFQKTKHPLVPLIDEVVRLSGPSDGGFVHWGITTQNIIQTGMLLQAKRASEIYYPILGDLLENLGHHAMTHADSIMAGRTHSRHAVPITFGFKVAGWIEEMFQAIERIKEAEARAFVVMMGGAVGCHSAIGHMGPKFQKRVAEILDMGEMGIPSRSIRTHICEYANALTLLASLCHRIAEEIYRSSCEEFGEIYEGVPEGAIGSSTMPQKVNPILSVQIIANSNKLYAQSAMMVSIAHRPFESDASANNIIENGIGEVIKLFASVIVPTESLIRNLVVDKDRMKENLNLTNGAIFAEYAMMHMGKKLGKHKSHELVHEMVMSAANGDQTFLNSIGTLPDGAELLNDIEQGMNGKNVTGLCAEMAKHFGQMATNVDLASLPDAAARSYLPIDGAHS